jgi:hypothetical protein
MKIVYFLVIILLGGCSNIKVNTTICEEVGSEPNTQNIPKECRNYDEKEANKAFFKNEEEKKADVEDIIKFDKKQE